MVVIARWPTEPTGSRQERTGAPSTCTVQAPHCAMPHPNLVPVSPTISRSTQSRGISGGASIFLTSPFIRRLTMRYLLKGSSGPGVSVDGIGLSLESDYRTNEQNLPLVPLNCACPRGSHRG